MPRFMAIILGDAAEAEAETDVDPAVWKQIMDEYNEFGENAAGVIGGGEALHPPSSAVGVKGFCIKFGVMLPFHRRSVYPDMCSTGTPGRKAAKSSARSIPPISGITTSVNNRWIGPGSSRATSNASRPLVLVTTV